MTLSNGTNGTNGHGTGTPGYVLPPAPEPSPISPAVSALFPDNTSPIVSSTYAHEPRPVRAIFIGAGLSGVAFAYKARLVEQLSYRIYEKNTDVGGVWFEHTYPGISCDVPAHGYSYTFRPNPDWSRFYAGGDEIKQWLQTQARDYELYENAKFEHEVQGAVWDDARGVWTVTVKNLATGDVFADEAEVLFNGSGSLNNWKWPAIDGLHDFGGALVHTARWDQGLDLAGKRVGVVGSGATGIQVVAAIHPQVQSLVSFNRSPTWIAPDFAWQLATEGRATRYSEAQRKEWREKPEVLREYRRSIEHAMNARFPSFYKSSEAQKQGQAFVGAAMRKKLAGRPDLVDKLVPPFELGCRRVTPGDGYLEALVAPNSTVVTAGIQRVTQKGVVDNEGTLHEVDVLICATGYDTTFVPRIPIVGLDGVNLQDKWRAEGAAAYLSVAVPGFPNYFVVLGPNSPISNGSLVGAMEAQLDYALAFVQKKLQRQRVHSFVVTEAAAREFDAWKNDLMRGLSFSGNCTSWYKSGTRDGPVVGPWPGSVNHFMEIIKEPRFEDFTFKFAGPNRFTYFGDGRSPKEAKGEPLGWYMK
ncbi:cyclohexanone monooxygenase [Sporothrix schenckii 1099-18]|uniref:Cyclohexanone monooxygenase n=1 Tax=Sporothrix schenckii 1099-18 TaxID=1397361 RepID=A0A0F2LSP7_SPOSC|nr:cyclohexanone monooxygenase [Sporothrix schenckii 1099-18]KJR80508.1 cyclohexanone monooxygenase [Sporothrix schenckii 1099-18]